MQEPCTPSHRRIRLEARTNVWVDAGAMYPGIVLTDPATPGGASDLALRPVSLASGGRSEAWLRDFLLAHPSVLPTAAIDLAYAKEIAGWDYADLQREVSIARGERGTDALFRLVSARHPDTDQAAFVDAVARNLARGRLMLL